MTANSTVTRLIFAIASVASTAIVIGSVLALADHYGSEAQVASIKPHLVAKR